MALAIVLAIVIGVALGMLGGGGSILTVPLFVYGLGMEAKPAIATSLLVVGIASFAALLRGKARSSGKTRLLDVSIRSPGKTPVMAHASWGSGEPCRSRFEFWSYTGPT